MDRKSRSLRSQEDISAEYSLWKQICSSLIKLEGIQKEEEPILNNINKIQSSVDFEKGKQSKKRAHDDFLMRWPLGITSIIQQKLKENYRRGIELSTNELE